MNLALLVLARTLGRDREFAIRLSVGATRTRIFRQLLTEQLLVGALGAAAACFVAVQSARAVLSVIGAPAGLAPQFNARVLVVAATLAIVSSLMFGFAPAWQTLRPVTVPRLRLRNVLLGVQVAAASALLLVSSLLVRGVNRIVRVLASVEWIRCRTAARCCCSRLSPLRRRYRRSDGPSASIQSLRCGTSKAGSLDPAGAV